MRERGTHGSASLISMQGASGAARNKHRCSLAPLDVGRSGHSDSATADASEKPDAPLLSLNPPFLTHTHSHTHSCSISTSRECEAATTKGGLGSGKRERERSSFSRAHLVRQRSTHCVPFSFLSLTAHHSLAFEHNSLSSCDGERHFFLSATCQPVPPQEIHTDPGASCSISISISISSEKP